jgi:hypothetical protein
MIHIFLLSITIQNTKRRVTFTSPFRTIAMLVLLNGIGNYSDGFPVNDMMLTQDFTYMFRLFF